MDIASCAGNPSGEACIAGQVRSKAIVTGVAAGIVGGTALSMTPAMLAAIESGVKACTINPVLCANEVGIFVTETFGAEAAPSGIAILGSSAYGAKLAKELSHDELAKLAGIAAYKKNGGDVTPEFVSKLMQWKYESGKYSFKDTGIVTDVKHPSGKYDGNSLPYKVNIDEVTATNAANYAKLKMDLRTTEAANEVIESLRNTGRLPQNYVDKTQAMKNGWKPGKALNNTTPGGQIGGDIFENITNILPSSPGRVWREADIGLSNTMSRSNQAGTRLLYSNDGLLYITTDHYETATSIGIWK
ncbi:hypothetical protein ACGTI2_21310 (plasmid) [Morganella morganii]|uniref:hypothetical protein n=1 Tax=Morganella morganii TaxID=582 RepID=UPI0038652A53